MTASTHTGRAAAHPNHDRTDTASTNVDSASRCTDASLAGLAGPARRRRLTILMLVLCALVATLLGTAGSASATIDAPGRGQVSESVYCNSNTHTVEVDFDTAGEQGNDIVGDLFQRFDTKPVWVIIWWWHNGSWNRTNWIQLPEGASSAQVSMSGTSYWYFNYAFVNPNGSFDTASEWAGGNGQAGWYSDQNGYHSLTSCNS